ncbi:MAG: TolC family protein [Acidiferrobacteraceae bacterium]
MPVCSEVLRAVIVVTATLGSQLVRAAVGRETVQQQAPVMISRPPLTLVAAERELLKNNPVVLQARQVRAALRHQAIAMRQLPDPEVGLMAQNVPVDSLALSQGQNAMLSVGISQHFPAFGRRAAEGRVGRAQSQSARYRVLATRAQSLLALRLAWSDAIYDAQALRLLRAQRALDDESVAAARARFRAGRISESEWLRARLDQQALGNQEAQAQALSSAAVAAIAALLARTTIPMLAPGWPSLPTPPTLAGLEARLNGNPALRAAHSRQEAAKAQIAVARSAYYPNVTVSGAYGKSYYPGMPNQVTMGVTLSVPLFTTDRQDQGLDAARARAAASGYTYQDQALRMLQKTRAQFATYISVKTQLERTRDTLVPTARLAFSAALAGYAAGTVEMRDLLRAQRSVLHYALLELSLRRERMATTAQLDYLATGVERQQ